MISAIAGFLGMIIRFIYGLVNNNYFISIILFTILTKILLFPLYYTQLKSTEKIKKIGPMDKKIRDKYKNDQQKMVEELNKLYSENKINPMGGCLPILIQIPLIFAMFAIVRQPLTYVLNMPQEQIVEYTKEVLQVEEISDKQANQNEIMVAKEKNLIDMEVFDGFNLGDTPANVFSKDESKKANPLALSIPILTIIFSIISNKMVQKNNQMTEEQAEMQKSMNLMMPLLSASIAYSMPLALGIYWLLGNILQIVQQIVLNLIMKHDEKKEALALLKEGGN